MEAGVQRALEYGELVPEQHVPGMEVCYECYAWKYLGVYVVYYIHFMGVHPDEVNVTYLLDLNVLV